MNNNSPEQIDIEIAFNKMHIADGTIISVGNDL